MRRELYLLAAALLFVSGNLTAGYILSCTAGSIRTAAALIFLTCIADIALIFLIKRRIPWIVLTAFPFLGASGAAAHEFFRPGPGTSSLSASRSMTVEGIISDGGLSSSGRPFLEVDRATPSWPPAWDARGWRILPRTSTTAGGWRGRGYSIPAFSGTIPASTSGPVPPLPSAFSRQE